MTETAFDVDISGREHTEEWRPIPGFEGYYEASNLGRVRGLDRIVERKDGTQARVKGRILKPRILDNGYVIVMMSKENKYQNQLVHRLVLRAFRGEAPDGHECCHTNGIRTDNRLENLRWDSHANNCADQAIHNTHRNGSKTHCKNGHEFNEENTYVRPNGKRLCRVCKRDYQNEQYARGVPYRRAS